MNQRLQQMLRVGSTPELVAALLMGLSYPVLMTAALLPELWTFVVAAGVSYASDHYLHRRGSYLLNRLSRFRAGLSLRFLIRQLLLVLLLSRMDMAEDPVSFTAIACFILFYALQAPHTALTAKIRARRRLPVITRNIDLAELGIADGPPGWLTNRAMEKVQHLDLFAVVGVLVVARTGDSFYGYVGMGATLVLTLLYTGLLARYLLPHRLPPTGEEFLEWFDGWLRRYRPTTVLYFSGSAESSYQVNMWLETMEELGGRPLVVLRERHTLARLAPTRTPVACVPSAVHLMNMDLDSVRVALYPANVGKNIHMLRVPTMKHVFIGHGDSDKIASINPYSKVYDEVWTAGKAGRDRYALADVGVRDDAVVEVGRPQLAPIQGPRRPKAMPTVLYAPTWEGWTDDPGNTSLMLAGENIVRGLLAAEPPVRVVYKPHPFTGTRSQEALEADARITQLLREAAERRAAAPEFAADAARGADSAGAARVELARIEAEMERLHASAAEGVDEAETARDALRDPRTSPEATDLTARWNEAFWRSFPAWEHRTVTGPAPTLYECFNASDGLVSDISSVVSDFLASGKPYAVTDSAGLGATEFARRNTAVRAAEILGNDARGLDAFLAAVRGEEDPRAGARAELTSYLLGPEEPAAQQRFEAAVEALAARAEARNAEQAAQSAAEDEPLAGARETPATVEGTVR